MAISSDILLERLHLKRQLTVWRLLALGSVIFFLVMNIEGRENVSPVSGDYVARVEITDLILDDKDRHAMLDDIEEDDRARALVVVLDTPGGTAVGGEALYHQLQRIAKKKPVVAVMRTMCTSAGYMIAIAADRIFALDSTLTGSIGVILQTAEFTDMASKLGINPITVKSGENKAAPSPAEKFTPEQRAIIQEVIDDFYATFIDMVAKSRNMTPEAVIKLSEGGRIYSGKQAQKNGLIDEIGGEEEAIKWLKKEKGIDDSLRVRDMKVKKEYDSVFDKLTDYTGLSFLKSDRLSLDGLLAIWQPQLL